MTKSLRDTFNPNVPFPFRMLMALVVCVQSTQTMLCGFCETFAETNEIYPWPDLCALRVEMNELGLAVGAYWRNFSAWLPSQLRDISKFIQYIVVQSDAALQPFVSEAHSQPRRNSDRISALASFCNQRYANFSSIINEIKDWTRKVVEARGRLVVFFRRVVAMHSVRPIMALRRCQLKIDFMWRNLIDRARRKHAWGGLCARLQAHIQVMESWPRVATDLRRSLCLQRCRVQIRQVNAMRNWRRTATNLRHRVYLKKCKALLCQEYVLQDHAKRTWAHTVHRLQWKSKWQWREFQHPAQRGLRAREGWIALAEDLLLYFDLYRSKYDEEFLAFHGTALQGTVPSLKDSLGRRGLTINERVSRLHGVL